MSNIKKEKEVNRGKQKAGTPIEVLMSEMDLKNLINKEVC